MFLAMLLKLVFKLHYGSKLAFWCAVVVFFLTSRIGKGRKNMLFYIENSGILGWPIFLLILLSMYRRFPYLMLILQAVSLPPNCSVEPPSPSASNGLSKVCKLLLCQDIDLIRIMLLSAVLKKSLAGKRNCCLYMKIKRFLIWKFNLLHRKGIWKRLFSIEVHCYYFELTIPTSSVNNSVSYVVNDHFYPFQTLFLSISKH